MGIVQTINLNQLEVFIKFHSVPQIDTCHNYLYAKTKLAMAAKELFYSLTFDDVINDYRLHLSGALTMKLKPTLPSGF